MEPNFLWQATKEFKKVLKEIKLTNKEPQFQSSYRRWVRIAAFILVLFFLPTQVLYAKATYSSSWTPTASREKMQNYSNNIMASLREEISGMRTHAKHMFGRDIAISLGSSFAMAGLSTVAKPWFNTATGAGSKILGLGPTARWAITGAVAGTAVHGLSTGQWFKGNWYLYTAGGAAAGAAVPSVAQAWNKPGSWLSPVRNASDSVSNSIRKVFTGKTLGASVNYDFQLAKVKVTDPGLMGNLGFSGVARGFANAGVVSLTSNLFTLAGMKQKQTELLSSFTSGVILGAVGGLEHLTKGLTGYVVPAISVGLTSAAYTYVTQLATDNGVKSRAAAIFIGNLAGLVTNTLVNGIAVNFSDTYISKAGNILGQKPSTTSTLTPFSYYAKYVWQANGNKIISGLVSNGLIEIITRNPKIIGLTAEDLQTLPYASAVGGVFGTGFNGSSSIPGSLARGLLSGALTIGEAKLEATILKHNPNMTPVMAAFLVDAASAATRGLFESFVLPVSYSAGGVFQPKSTAGSIFYSLADALGRDSLNIASFGYLGREQSLLGEISYIHTLTETFGPRTPEMLKQQMAKNSLSGTAIGNGSTVNLSLSNGTIATLNLIGSSNNIMPFMGTDPRKGLKYTDISGNTWVSNGNGTYSLASESKQDQGSSFIAGWGQISHDIYQSGAVRNMEASLVTLLPDSANRFLNLPVTSFMTDYLDQEGKLRTDRVTMYQAQPDGIRPLTIENRWGNVIDFEIVSALRASHQYPAKSTHEVKKLATTPPQTPTPASEPAGAAPDKEAGGVMINTSMLGVPVSIVAAAIGIVQASRAITEEKTPWYRRLEDPDPYRELRNPETGQLPSVSGEKYSQAAQPNQYEQMINQAAVLPITGSVILIREAGLGFLNVITELSLFPTRAQLKNALTTNNLPSDMEYPPDTVKVYGSQENGAYETELIKVAMGYGNKARHSFEYFDDKTPLDKILSSTESAFRTTLRITGITVGYVWSAPAKLLFGFMVGDGAFGTGFKDGIKAHREGNAEGNDYVFNLPPSSGEVIVNVKETPDGYETDMISVAQKQNEPVRHIFHYPEEILLRGRRATIATIGSYIANKTGYGLGYIWSGPIKLVGLMGEGIGLAYKRIKGSFVIINEVTR